MSMPTKSSSTESSHTKKSAKDRLIGSVDAFQQRHHWLGFPYAVQKKYSEDEAGNQAALVTYYGFLSLFPLLVVALSLTQLSLLRSAHLKSKLIAALNNNLPLVSSQLQNNVHASQKAGLAFAVSLLLTFYGARGVASALQNAMNHIWQIPKFKRGGLGANVKSIGIIILLGVGFLLSGALSSYATAPRSDLGLKIVAVILSSLVSFGVILFIFRLSVAVKHPLKEFFVGSIVAAVGFQIVQGIGGFLITHEVKKLSSFYGTFAIILAILFWIYLLARIMLYATEIDTVRGLKLWPRSLTSKPVTPADQKVLKMYAGRERYDTQPKEEVAVRFR